MSEVDHEQLRVGKEDVRLLRDAGWDDQAIREITALATCCPAGKRAGGTRSNPGVRRTALRAGTDAVRFAKGTQ